MLFCAGDTVRAADGWAHLAVPALRRLNVGHVGFVQKVCALLAASSAKADEWHKCCMNVVCGPTQQPPLRVLQPKQRAHAGPYSATVLLPQTEFSQRAMAKAKEPEIQQFWQDNDVYMQLCQQNTGDAFTLHDGPPYANGALHFGHALNKILKDFVNRRKLLEGRKARFVPGWDTHGLPIELKVRLQHYLCAADRLPVLQCCWVAWHHSGKRDATLTFFGLGWVAWHRQPQVLQHWSNTCSGGWSVIVVCALYAFALSAHIVDKGCCKAHSSNASLSSLQLESSNGGLAT